MIVVVRIFSRCGCGCGVCWVYIYIYIYIYIGVRSCGYKFYFLYFIFFIFYSVCVSYKNIFLFLYRVSYKNIFYILYRVSYKNIFLFLYRVSYKNIFLFFIVEWWWWVMSYKFFLYSEWWVINIFLFYIEWVSYKIIFIKFIFIFYFFYFFLFLWRPNSASQLGVPTRRPNLASQPTPAGVPNELFIKVLFGVPPCTSQPTCCASHLYMGVYGGSWKLWVFGPTYKNFFL
jgi:hypothetical protein